MQRPIRAATCLAVLALLAASGCSRHASRTTLPDRAATITAPRADAILGGNQPPVVTITHPVPTPLFVPAVPPSVQITWQGHDPDGVSTQEPVQYRYRLFTARNPDVPQISDFIAFAILHPDSVVALYGPQFASWDAVDGTTTSVQYTNLVPGTQYLFMITAFDEAGEFDRVFTLNTNMLRMNVTFEGAMGPRLTMYNQAFNYTYPAGGYHNDAAHTVPLEWPAGQPVTVNWFAEPISGADIRWYRWALDMPDLSDETPRVTENTELYRWSQRSLTTTSATFGPFTPPPRRLQTHLLYIEVEDTNGLRSLGIVNLTIRAPGRPS